MRHQKKRHKLGRTAAHRKRTLQALSNALIEHKRITTTEAKAKALRPFIEPLITRAKSDTSHNRRQVFRHLQDKRAVTALFTDVAVEVGDRPGGYTRIVKLGQRAGDAAEMAMIELVDYNDVQPEGTESGSGRSRTRRGGGKGRRRRSSSKKKAQPAEETAPEATTTQTAEQQQEIGGTVETEAVEEPVAEAQKVPVTERTDAGPEVEEEEIKAAQAAAEEEGAEEDTPAEASAEEPSDNASADDEDEKEGKA